MFSTFNRSAAAFRLSGQGPLSNNNPRRDKVAVRATSSSSRSPTRSTVSFATVVLGRTSASIRASSSANANGFTKQSSPPLRSPRTRSSTSPSALAMRAGTSILDSRSFYLVRKARKPVRTVFFLPGCDPNFTVGCTKTKAAAAS